MKMWKSIGEPRVTIIDTTVGACKFNEDDTITFPIKDDTIFRSAAKDCDPTELLFGLEDSSITIKPYYETKDLRIGWTKIYEGHKGDLILYEPHSIADVKNNKNWQHPSNQVSFTIEGIVILNKELRKVCMALRMLEIYFAPIV